MKISTLSLDAVRRALTIRDLTNSQERVRHAMQLIIKDAGARRYNMLGIVKQKFIEHSPIVSIQDNYDHLKYPTRWCRARGAVHALRL